MSNCPARAAHPHHPVVHRLVPCFGDVEHAAGFVQQERIAVLVEHVGRHRARRADIARVQRLDLEGVVADTDHHAAVARVDGAQAAALGDLSCVPGGADAGTAQQRQRCQHGGVGGAPAQHDVGARLQRGHVGLGSHQCNDVLAGIEQCRAVVRHRRQRRDLARARLGLQQRGLLLGVQQRDARMQAMLACNLQRDVAHPVERHVAARGAAGPDEQWQARTRLCAHQDRKVGLDGVARVLRPARRQVGGPAVGGSCIAGNGMCAGRETRFDVGLAHARSERAGRHQHVHRVLQAIGHAAPLPVREGSMYA